MAAAAPQDSHSHHPAHHAHAHHAHPHEHEASFWMGGHTHRVPMSMHAGHRQKLTSRLAKLGHTAGFVLLQGAVSALRDDTDHEHLIRQESFFQYLFGVKEPDCYAGINLANGNSLLFIPHLPRSYQVWMGRILSKDEFKDMYAVDEVYYVEELKTTLEGQSGPEKKLFVLSGKNTDSGSSHAGAKFDGIDGFLVDHSILMPELTECRVIKSKEEIDVMRYICKVSSDAHEHVMKTTKPEMMEYQLEANFQHFAYYHGGARNMSYTCICAAGSNSATLHYGHAGAPNSRHVRPNHMLLLDMGAEYHCYGADITRSFPSDGKYNTQQKAIYGAVLAAQKAVMAAAKPGVSWPSMHRLAERVILQHLLQLKLVKGSLEDLEKNFIANLFMPHGLGHLLGLDTHDVGGYPNGQVRSTEPGLRSLRCGRNLEAGMIITVEPGIYFNWPELELHLSDPTKEPFLNAEEITKYKDFGGVRIEDDILITETGMENLTTVPSEIDQVEAILATNPHIIAHHAKH